LFLFSSSRGSNERIKRVVTLDVVALGLLVLGAAVHMAWELS
jgi:hypothetical protein